MISLKDKKVFIPRISNGLGNQMFLYAFSYSIAKKLGRKLLLDIYSGPIRATKKHIYNKYLHYTPRYELDIFKISAKICPTKYCFDTTFKHLLRKLLIFVDFFLFKKKFIFEKKNNQKKTKYSPISSLDNFRSITYIEGNFESEKYFLEYKKDLTKEFAFKKKINVVPEIFNKIIKLNSVSLSFRADRFVETLNDNSNLLKIKNQRIFEKKQLNFLKRSISFFNKKIKNPFFFIFSDNPKKAKYLISEFLTPNVFFVDQYLNDKVKEDFYLMTFCKYFAVSPTSFHFWAAWLSNYKNKICIRPKDINISNNIHFWPVNWIKI